MRTHMRLSASVLMLACSLFAFVAPAHAQDEIVPDEVVVGIKPASDRPIVKAQLSYMAGLDVEHNPTLHTHRIKLKPGLSVDAAIAALKKRPEVLYAEPNHVYRVNATPNDASYGAKQYAPQKVQADAAWDIWKPQGTAVIAIVDTGIDYTHPDLANKILRDASGNVIGKNTAGSNAHSGNPADPSDDHGHGTHCAGIAAATINNATGVAGIAGWNGLTGTDTSHIKLMPVKVLTSIGTGTDTTVANGITFAANNGANVISMSLGGGGSTTLSNAVAYAWGKGCVIVAAAGNSHMSTKDYPAGYPNVISVAATDKTDTLAYYSNYGSWVTCCAPGGGATSSDNIFSTLPSYSASIGVLNYGGMSGTSMACPLVSGEAALILAQVPTLSNSQVKSFITSNVDPYTPYQGRTIGAGAGRVNVYKALAAAGGGTATAPPAPSGLTATGGDTTIALSWNSSAGATSYNVKRSLTSGSGYVQIATGVTSTNYTDTGLTNGVTYYYVVTAVNSVGESGNSNEASATPQANQLQQLILNPGFELGALAVPWVYTSGIVTNSTSSQAPHGGSWYVWMGGKGVKYEYRLWQDVIIPATITKATLTFWVHIDTVDTATTAVDLLQVQLKDPVTGAFLKQLGTMSNLNKNTGYVQKTYDLTAWKGKAIRLFLQGSENLGGATSFTLDDFSLTVQ